VPSTYLGDTWPIDKLKRVLLSYDASAAMYSAVGSKRTPISKLKSKLWEGWEKLSGYDSNLMLKNGVAPKSAKWYQNCPGFDSIYGESFQMFRFDDEKSATLVATANVSAQSSPSGLDEFLISFGGTNSAGGYGQVQQIISDASIASHNLEYRGKDLGYVHEGFWNSVAAFVDPIHELVKREIPPSKIVTVTGHSLGAAQAVIFANFLSIWHSDYNIKLYTFGTPRVGSPKFVQGMDGQTNIEKIRFVNQNDIVTMIPTSLGVGRSVLHAGPQVTLAHSAIGSDCTDWSVTAQYKDLAKNALSTVSESSCVRRAIDAHTQYGTNIVSWAQAHGLPSASLTCGPKARF